MAERLAKLGLKKLRLPLGTSETDKHVPILVSPDLETKNRVIVLFSERDQDLGIFSYRVIGEEGINIGSAVNFVTSILSGQASKSGGDVPGIILTNPGQLLWYRGGGQAISRTQWYELPRSSAVEEPMRIDEERNAVEYNRDYQEHVNYVLRNVIEIVVNKNARIDLIGLEWTGQAALKYLAANWDGYSARIGGICLACPQHTLEDLEPEEFRIFVEQRCRAYIMSSSPAPLGTLMTEGEDFGCDCISSGEELYSENIIIRASGHMLKWLGQLD